MLKNSQKTRNKRKSPKLFKDHLQKLTTKIILNNEKLDAFLLRSGIRQGCPLFTIPIVLEILVIS